MTPQDVPVIRVPLVYVEWRDACSYNGWVPTGEINPRAKPCASVGWLKHRDRHTVVLCPTVGFNDDGDMTTASGTIIIPRGMIVLYRVLRSAKTKR